MYIVGVDCATQKKNTGLSLAAYKDDKCRIIKACTASKEKSVAETIAGWLDGEKDFLLAMDAPLGWPADLGVQLNSHNAGDVLSGEPNNLFRRMTDRYVKDEIGKTPLDVGADRIARTAHAALAIIQDLRELKACDIGMGWTPGVQEGAWAIEVYPAATLKTYGMVSSGYKGNGKEDIRSKMLGKLKEYISIDISLEDGMVGDDDVLDSALCVLAGIDYLRGQVHIPSDKELVRKEGWIWFRNTSGNPR